MKITIVYDNEAGVSGLESGWGFSCLIEGSRIPDILFDTGADASKLLHNMDQLGVNVGNIAIVFISHGYIDHIGGLEAILQLNDNATVYVPAEPAQYFRGPRFRAVRKAIRICNGVYSTGQLSCIEQALVLGDAMNLTVVTGSSHTGLTRVIEAASRFGNVRNVVGGFGEFWDIERLNSLSLVCPCHCTAHKSEIANLLPQKCIQSGVGSVIEL
jgi:7,8-dihydropterin-6-yl-methyl-4-(beta-D-ribofuranosyl)aminobenzene 5'-phosphate synthase